MFNNKASDSERHKKLEDLIRKDYEEDEEEVCEIPTDDQVNELISRNDKEYELYTKMDRDRYQIEKRDERIEDIK